MTTVTLTDVEVAEAMEEAKRMMIHAAMRKTGLPYPIHGRVEGIFVQCMGDVRVVLSPIHGPGLRLVKGGKGEPDGA